VPVPRVALVFEVLLVVELEPLAAVVPLVLVRVGIALAAAPVLAFAVAECWRSEPLSVAAWSQAAPQ
jgi:hypothetical protein